MQSGYRSTLTTRNSKTLLPNYVGLTAPMSIILDNLSLVGGNYNDAKLIHSVNQFVFQLTLEFNAAIVITAHPRKKDKKANLLLNSGFEGGTGLRQDPEGFSRKSWGVRTASIPADPYGVSSGTWERVAPTFLVGHRDLQDNMK